MLHRLLIVRPNESFSSRQELLQTAGLPGLAAEELHYFQLPLIAIILSIDGLPHAKACNFLLEKAIKSRGITGDTARSYGEALCDWLNFLVLNECPPTHATEELLGLYRLHLLGARPGSRTRQASTANHRLVVAAEYHRWGQRSKNLESPLGNFLERSLQTGDGRNRLNPRWRNPNSYLAAVDKRLPKILTQEEIVRLFKVAPRPFDLMFRWAIATALLHKCRSQLR